MASLLWNIDFLRDIYEEFSITEETLKKDVETLMQWLDEQPHLPNVKDPNFLALFFLRCKGRMEKTKETLQAYYITKARLPGVFRNRDPNSAEYKKLFNVMTIIRSRRVTENGNGVLTLRVGNVPEDGLPSAKEYLKYVMMQALIHVLMAAPCKKFVVVLDYRNSSVSMVNYQLRCMKSLKNLSLKVIPGRFEKFYLLHSSLSDVQPMISFGRKFSKKLFNNRMVVWNEAATELREQISPECLPIEYGGTEGSFQHLAEQFLEEVKSWKWWLDDEEQYISDLSRRPANLKEEEEEKEENDEVEESGRKGSFRRINAE